MGLRVADKVCLITGSNAGIGEGIARQLAAEGARVVIHGRREAPAQQVAADLRAAGAEATVMLGDVADPAVCERLVSDTVAAYGRLDVLVHNAGISTRGTVVDMTLADWEQVFRVNVTAAFLLAKHAIPVMQAAGGGSIIHIGSAHTALPKRNMAGYCASRGALLMLTRQMAVDYVADRIRVNLVNPGWVDTPGERDLMVRLGQPAGILDQAAASNPFGRLLAPRDIAYLVTYLASDESELVTGSVFDVHHEHPLVA